MAQIGVMPMPPAMRRLGAAPDASGMIKAGNTSRCDLPLASLVNIARSPGTAEHQQRRQCPGAEVQIERGAAPAATRCRDKREAEFKAEPHHLTPTMPVAVVSAPDQTRITRAGSGIPTSIGSTTGSPPPSMVTRTAAMIPVPPKKKAIITVAQDADLMG